MGRRDPRCEVDGCRYIAAIGSTRCVEHGATPPTRVPDGDAPIDKMPKCGARRRDGGFCRQPPRRGNARCKLHGASTEAAIQRGLERVEEAKIVENVRQYGTPRKVSPLDALEQELHRTQGHVDWLDGQVALRGADPHLLAVYQSERAHLTKLTAQAMQYDVGRRRIELNERTLDTLERAFEGVVTDLGLQVTDQYVREVVGRNLMRAVRDDGKTPSVDELPVEAPPLTEDMPGRVDF